jgi:hypothetical protein
MEDYRFRPFGKLWPFLLVVPVLLGAAPDPLETVEKAAADWVKTRAEAARLDTEWNEQQRLLESMVNGFAERAATLEAKRDFLRAKTAKDREDMAALQAANQAGTAGLDAAEARLKAMDARMVELRPSLPPRLSEALELPYRSLAGSAVPLGERMQLTMTVLNRCMQFNRSITSEEELLAPDGGPGQRLLEVIYWGLSHGYALDRAAGKAWFGAPGPQGWHWEPLADGAAPVARLIAVYQGKTEPVFVEVPARVKTETADAARN